MIQYPDFSKPLYVGTDASKYGVGCVLFQLEDGKKKFLRIASRSLTTSERNYGAPQRELLAVLHALRAFYSYLFGHHFVVYSDAQSLKYLLTREKVSPVIRNWMDEILQFDFVIEHRPGVLQHFEDAVSRIYDNDHREEESKIDYGSLLLSITEDQQLCTAIDDDLPSDLIQSAYTEDLQNLEVVVDSDQQSDLMFRAHALGHCGAADMARQIRSVKQVTWPNLERHCQVFVSSCLPCQRVNVYMHGYHPPKNVTALLPFDRVFIDLKEMKESRRGNMYYLALIDCATRYTFLRALPDKAMHTVAQALLGIFCDIGFPKIMQSDNGTEFMNQVVIALKAASKIEERIIAPYNHRSNGTVERVIQTTSQMLYKHLAGLVTQWDDHLSTVQFAYNTRVIGLHGSSPYSLLFGRQPNGFESYDSMDLKPETTEERDMRLLFLNSVVYPTILEKVKGTHSKRNEAFARSRRMLTKEFLPGSLVMIKDELRSSKSDPKYEGPFTIMRRKDSGNYLLRSVEGTEYVRPPNVLKPVSPEILKGLDVQDTIYAEVDHILDHKTDDKGETLYKVRWKNQGAVLDSWLAHKDFLDYGPIQAYVKRDSRKSKKLRKHVSFDDKEMEHSAIPKSLPVSKVSQPVHSMAQKSVTEPELEAQEQVHMDLGTDQAEAVGKYWQTMSTRRSKRQSSDLASKPETDD